MMRTTGALGGTGPGAYLYLQITGGGAFTALDSQGAGYAASSASDCRIGIGLAGNTTWQTVIATIRITTTGTLFVKCIMGDTGAGNTGVAKWDDVRLLRQAPNVSIGGYRGSQSIDDTGTIYVPDTTTVQVGTQSTPSSKAKTVRIGPQLFVPQQTASKWTYSLGSLACGVTAALQEWQHAVYLPKGATVTAMRARVLRANSGDSNVLVLYRVDDAGATTTLATITTGVSASVQTLSQSLSEVIATDKHYILDLQMNAATSTANALFFWGELDYSIPDYGKGI